MLRPFRITLDRFINRRRSKDFYETVFFLFFHIFPAFLQNRLLDSGVMHQDEECLPLAFLPGAIGFPPPMDGDGVAPYGPDFLRAPCFPPPSPMKW